MECVSFYTMFENYHNLRYLAESVKLLLSALLPGNYTLVSLHSMYVIIKLWRDFSYENI